MKRSYQQHRLPPLPKTQGRGTLGFVMGRKNDPGWLGARPAWADSDLEPRVIALKRLVSTKHYYL
jgi:hypothetical protein